MLKNQKNILDPMASIAQLMTFVTRFFIYTLIIICVGACTESTTDKKVFKYNQINPITSLDPAFAKSQNNIWACHHLYNTLVRFNENLEIEPDLASSYQISEDGKSYTFYLRNGINFHPDKCFGDAEQRPVVAEDVKYSIERLQDENIQSPGSWLLKEKLDSNGIVCLADSVIQFNLREPFAPFLGLLANKYCSVIPKEAVNYYGTLFRKNPVGTGPFRLKRWLETEAMFLFRNDDYFRNNVFIDAIKISFITDRKMAYLELLNGKLDLVSGIESSFLHRLLNPDGTLKDENKGQLNFFKSPYLNSEYLGINLEACDTKSPLNNKKFRQALNLAIDRKSMLESLRNNIGSPASKGFIPKGLPSHESISLGYDYNPKLAKELISALDLPPFEEQEGIIINTNADYLDISTFVAKQWENIGIKANVEMFESALLRQGMRAGRLPMFRASWIADYPDGENFLCLFYGANPAPPNYTRFKSSMFDNLYLSAQKETHISKRHALYAKMENIIQDEAPIIFLFYDQAALFTSTRIKQIKTNALNLLEVEDLILE